MSSIIEFKNISKYYNKDKIIDNFNLHIEKGSFLSIVGTSGSGKTTILKMINGMITPDEGKIFIRERDIKEIDLISLRRNIGYSIQGTALFPHMTVEENISYVPRLENRDREEIDKIVDNMLELVHLPSNLKNRYPSELSGGQQQRVGIARAYANNPDILLMDEPFGAVDAITRYNLQKDLKEIHRLTNCTIIFITHDICEALKLSTHILVLDKRKIEQFGSAEEIKNSPATPFVKKLIKMLE